MAAGDSCHTKLPFHPCRQAATASAAEDTTAAAVAPAPDAASTSSSSSAPSSVLQQFVDNEYELQYPSNYTFIETPIVRVERGPQPERSPVLARFEAPNGEPGTISILMRRANALKQTILQVCAGVWGVRGWVWQQRSTPAQAANRRSAVSHCVLSGTSAVPAAALPHFFSWVVQQDFEVRTEFKLQAAWPACDVSSSSALCCCCVLAAGRPVCLSTYLSVCTRR